MSARVFQSFLPICLGLFVFLSLPLIANPIPYSKIEPKLSEVWAEQFPVPFQTVLKKDLMGKGIIQYRDKPNRVGYLYSFLVFMPRYEREGMTPVPTTQGREIIVRLLHFPGDKENPFEIRLGEFEESYQTKSHLKYIK